MILRWCMFWLNGDQVGQKIKFGERRKWDKLGCKGDKRVGTNHFLVSTYFPSLIQCNYEHCIKE